MPEDEREDDDVESGEGSAGEPEALDPEAARERWSSRRGQPKSKFDELQARIGSRRRRGGPDHPGEDAAQEDAQDSDDGVPATEPEDEE